MKKLKVFLASAVFAFCGVSLFAADVALRLMPDYNILSDSRFDKMPGGYAGLEVDVFKLRQRDNVYFTLLGGLLPLSASGIDTIYVKTGTVGAGYEYRLSDRFSIAAEGFAGIYAIGEDDTQGFTGESGVIYGGRGFVHFHLMPELSAGLFAGYSAMYYEDKPAMDSNLEIGLSLRYNFTKGLVNTASIDTVESTLQPVFPVFYSHYENHPFGSITFVNSENNDISDVEVYVYIEQFMANPTLAFSIPAVKRGESFTAELTAFLNENILNNLTASETSAVISVSYTSLWKNVSYEKPVIITTLGRNSMTWADDRQAASFVSGKDAAAYLLANRVKSTVKDSLVPGVPENIQYAAAIFATLKLMGINYVVDPASAFTSNAGTDSIDFLQFPYQTLLYHGGDCDDLTILNCSLLEAIGIETAFITIPGHIYMAFDSGLKPSEKAKAGDCLVIDDKVWIPLEITLTKDTFKMERQVGFRQWNRNKENAVLIPLKESWKEFKPVAIPDSDIKMELPSKDAVLSEFRKQL